MEKLEKLIPVKISSKPEILTEEDYKQIRFEGEQARKYISKIFDKMEHITPNDWRIIVK